MNETRNASLTRTIDGAPLRALARELIEADEVCATDLVLVANIAELRARVEIIERSVVAAAREQGATWDQIGSAYGMTRQAAYQRFGKLNV